MELNRLLFLAGLALTEAKEEDKKDDAECEKCDATPCECEDDDDKKDDDKDDDDDKKDDDKDDDDDKKEDVKESYDFGSVARMRFLAGLGE